MYFRYSSCVVAPMQRSSPLASMGFSRFAASIAPSPFPPPISRCTSSMKRTICPWASFTSARTAVSRSSNSPRYFAPATRAPMSREYTRQALSVSGTSPITMRCASPSTIAVFPTPGSPISTGLFFVRRASTWMTRRVSSSRPITGSSLLDSASVTRSRPYLESAWKFSSPVSLATFREPRSSFMACSILAALKLAADRASRMLFGLMAARKRSGRLRCESPCAFCSFSASFRAATSALFGGMWSGEGRCDENLPMSLSHSLRSWATSPPTLESTVSASAPCSLSSRRAARTWTGSS
mmetsp:Transcript_50477/g.109820  ORF Transcript_50477/g.109820 Transcript_50477/m.109820 type:complete len:297 (-) Transcript_50477:125-1015(-)